ncbi:hypothetical protein ES705_43064 [subsurface metagenome]
MAKRVYTKCFSGYLSATGVAPVVTLNAFPWLMQEDVTIIGLDLSLGLQVPSENDGFTCITLEVSQIGAWGADGSIASVMAAEGWNTTPAGISVANGHTLMFFPDGRGIDIKEEGALYINTQTKGKSAGSTTWNFHVVILYEKKSNK